MCFYLLLLKAKHLQYKGTDIFHFISPKRACLLDIDNNIIKKKSEKKVSYWSRDLTTIFLSISNNCSIKLFMNNDYLTLLNFRI